MPTLVVGADTEIGEAAVAALLPTASEVRVFVTDASVAETFKDHGAKVAIGDVSDESHVGAAATNCYSVVFVGEASRDDRERAFAESADSVMAGWVEAIRGAQVSRVIWVDEAPPPAGIDSLNADVVVIDTKERRPKLVAEEIATADAKG